MAVWAKVRDLPFELKTESMGWILGDHLGEVIDVSHRIFVMVEKFIRVHVAILLHEPLKTTVEFTPLGSSKIDTFDVRYEKLPLYCECCGIVGHTSERFCNIPREKRIASYPKNISVDSYWKAQGASKIALSFGNMPRGDKPQVASADYNKSASAMEGIVFKVAKVVSDLMVADKEAAASANLVARTKEGTRQDKHAPDQEGRVLWVAPLPPGSVGLGQEDRVFVRVVAANPGQEGQGMAVLKDTCTGVVHVQEGHNVQHLGHSSMLSAASSGQQATSAKVNQGNHALAMYSHNAKVDAYDALQSQLLFQHGVLEALSGAGVSRLAAMASDTAKTGTCSKFNAVKFPVQDQPRKRGTKGRKKRESGKYEAARGKVLGEKRGHPFSPRPTGSDLVFSFEKSLDSCECMLYSDFTVSSKRVCRGRVETVHDVEEVVTHVAREIDEKDEYVQQRKESVGEEKGENGALVAPEKGVRRAK
ncbi:hypothetical protein D1007_17470 [Hordeum vulgare]|nr:hypothetical protein D1007_17470 [Hordeum vulgare]